MKEVLIISGKGGCGKTSICASFAKLSDKAVFVDCDVDASDLHLLLKPRILKRAPFFSGALPSLSQERCMHCGTCVACCRFHAFDDYPATLSQCEGCGLCAALCPAHAITMEPRLCGETLESETAYGKMFHARLLPGGENSGKLIAEIRKNAREAALAQSADLILSDGPPGIGCPVISSLSGVDLALIVTEPTLSGLHDMERTVQLARSFEVTAEVIINKFNLNPIVSEKIEEFCRQQNIAIAGRLPFDAVFNTALRNGKTIVDYPDSSPAAILKSIWKKIQP